MWHAPGSNFTGGTYEINPWHELENFFNVIIAASPYQRVKKGLKICNCFVTRTTAIEVIPITTSKASASKTRQWVLVVFSHLHAAITRVLSMWCVTLEWHINDRNVVSNSGIDQRKHQITASLAFVRGICWWPENSWHKGPVTRKMFPFDDVIKRNSTVYAIVYG